MNIIEKIDLWALKSPNTIAFKNFKDEISYYQLKIKSDALSNWILKSLNDPEKSQIIVYGHMQVEMLPAFLGCVKAGHAYIPVDESTPIDRLKKIIDNSASQLIILLNPEMDFEYEDTKILGIDQLQKIFKQAEKIDCSKEYWVKEDENFYIIYTSGSTGEPKGVQISSICLGSFIDWMLTDFGITQNQRFLNQAPFSFDLSVMDLYPCLVSGGTLVAIEKHLINKPKEMYKFLGESDVEIWVSTPSFVEMCMMNKEFNESLMPTIKSFFFCGEVLTTNCAQKLLERFPSANVFNTYGPTEATVAVTSVKITKDIILNNDTLPIGIPKKDTNISIVNHNGEPLPDGEKGEIIISGPSVSKGYLRNQEKTNEVFSKHQGVFAYKTGDSGNFINGLLYYTGRIDLQVKLHGYRIELEDIENNIQKVPLVKNVVVIPKVNQGKCTDLHVIAVVKDHKFEKEYQLTNFLKKALVQYMPTYMIPRQFSYVSQLPMTSNGKINRRLLEEQFVKN
ncbi:D-alanine--poly(phosphoribitol) ligase subunit DltA [Gottfriedia luciferensis]|uniref:D-alanine--poly(phosphoribitol) ligase subunit DltA n=1 Tax=Gottfriedia luciferensis TaxID=178774 RepID=UPI000B442FA5|nr:D-alanine--poly(phosphoribitol) ligase subunit DltA [Gottfriedia luciferensis]